MEAPVSIFLNHFVWAQYFKEGGRQLGLSLDDIGQQLMQLEEFPEPVLAPKCLAWRGRLLHRLMQQLPWQTHGAKLWVDGDPESRHRQWGGPGFELRVPVSRLDEVMRVLLPLVRQLRAQVMVPSRKLWFAFHNIVSPGADAQLDAWDPAWRTTEMGDEVRRRLVIDQFKARLEPLGFEFEDGPRATFRFERPLKHGGGYQIVAAGAVDFRVHLAITSATYLRLLQQRNPELKGARLRGYGADGYVVNYDMETDSHYPFDTLGYEEDSAWYFEEFERLFLPALAHLHTAKDLYEWYWDERWKPVNRLQWGEGGIYNTYAARYLPDAEFQAVANRFLQKTPDGPPAELVQLMLTHLSQADVQP